MSRARAVLAGVGAAVGLAACGTSTSPDARYLDAYFAAARNVRPFAPITDTQPDKTIAEAYVTQQRFVAARLASGDQTAGYKGGLMSQKSMDGRHIKEPLVAVLFASGRTQSGQPVSLCGYRRAALEAKLGFVFNADVRQLPADKAALSMLVSQVEPVVDLPDIAYRDPDHYGAVDMVAANVTAARYVIGASRPPMSADLDSLKVLVTRDGQTVTSGVGSESLGNQWDSLRTVIRLILASGRTIKAGDLVLTGKIGDREWLPAGNYVSDFGPLGDVRFAVEPCAGH